MCIYAWDEQGSTDVIVSNSLNSETKNNYRITTKSASRFAQWGTKSVGYWIQFAVIPVCTLSAASVGKPYCYYFFQLTFFLFSNFWWVSSSCILRFFRQLWLMFVSKLSHLFALVPSDCSEYVFNGNPLGSRRCLFALYKMILDIRFIRIISSSLLNWSLVKTTDRPHPKTLDIF